MRQVERSAIVPFTAEAMFDLVADVESYPKFLPGCSASSIHSRHDDEVVARLSLARGPLKFEFTTRNRLVRGTRITMDLEEGPFSDLKGAWEFTPIGPQGCRASLTLRFAFESGVTDLLLGPAFESLCTHLIEVFVSRAKAVYG